MLVEHARTLVGISDATHAEYGRAGTPIVTLLACSLNGTQTEVMITAGSRLATIYQAGSAVEQTTCNYGLDPTHADVAASHGMRVAAVDATQEVRDRTGGPSVLRRHALSAAAHEPAGRSAPDIASVHRRDREIASIGMESRSRTAIRCRYLILFASATA